MRIIAQKKVNKTRRVDHMIISVSHMNLCYQIQLCNLFNQSKKVDTIILI